MSSIEWLQGWYHSNCDGFWEHSYGVKIDTLDNPGWSVSIDLADTKLEGKVFKEVKEERTQVDWILCRVSGTVFEGYGGPGNLIEIIDIFKQWAEENTPARIDP